MWQSDILKHFIVTCIWIAIKNNGEEEVILPFYNVSFADKEKTIKDILKNDTKQWKRIKDILNDCSVELHLSMMNEDNQTMEFHWNQGDIGWYLLFCEKPDKQLPINVNYEGYYLFTNTTNTKKKENMLMLDMQIQEIEDCLNYNINWLYLFGEDKARLRFLSRL